MAEGSRLAMFHEQAPRPTGCHQPLLLQRPMHPLLFQALKTITRRRCATCSCRAACRGCAWVWSRRRQGLPRRRRASGDALSWLRRSAMPQRWSWRRRRRTWLRWRGSWRMQARAAAASHRTGIERVSARALLSLRLPASTLFRTLLSGRCYPVQLEPATARCARMHAVLPPHHAAVCTGAAQHRQQLRRGEEFPPYGAGSRGTGVYIRVLRQRLAELEDTVAAPCSSCRGAAALGVSAEAGGAFSMQRLQAGIAAAVAEAEAQPEAVRRQRIAALRLRRVPVVRSPRTCSLHSPRAACRPSRLGSAACVLDFRPAPLQAAAHPPQPGCRQQVAPRQGGDRGGACGPGDGGHQGAE